VAKNNFLQPKTLEKQYKNRLSNFREWEKEIDPKALVYPKNFGKWMSIDEVALSKGELYTVITNKEAHSRKGALAGIIEGTKSEVVSKALEKVPIAIRMNVKEITLDFAISMDWICRTNFPNAQLTGDRFHIQQIVTEGLQEMRIELRRKAINEENELVKEAKKERKEFWPRRYSNGDTKKQLLARGRYLLFKPSTRWTPSQRERAEILFEKFPELKKGYDLTMMFRAIFETAKTQEKAKERMENWFQKVSESHFAHLISAANTVQQNLGKVLNYFPNGSTNASAESFNAKLKGFRALVRGVRDINFFYSEFQLFMPEKPSILYFKVLCV
jgi:transposase